MSGRSFGEIIKRARYHHDFSQEKLAQKSGISRRHIQNIENGTTEINKIKMGTILKLSAVLNLKIEDILVSIKDYQVSDL